MIIREFVCDDCKTDVVSIGGPDSQTCCGSCVTIRQIKARDPMTPESEAALREILGCVIPVRKGEDGVLIMEINIDPDEP